MFLRLFKSVCVSWIDIRGKGPLSKTCPPLRVKFTLAISISLWSVMEAGSSTPLLSTASENTMVRTPLVMFSSKVISSGRTPSVMKFPT